MHPVLALGCLLTVLVLASRQQPLTHRRDMELRRRFHLSKGPSGVDAQRVYHKYLKGDGEREEGSRREKRKSRREASLSESVSTETGEESEDSRDERRVERKRREKGRRDEKDSRRRERKDSRRRKGKDYRRSDRKRGEEKGHRHRRHRRRSVSSGSLWESYTCSSSTTGSYSSSSSTSYPTSYTTSYSTDATTRSGSSSESRKRRHRHRHSSHRHSTRHSSHRHSSRHSTRRSSRRYYVGRSSRHRRDDSRSYSSGSYSTITVDSDDSHYDRDWRRRVRHEDVLRRAGGDAGQVRGGPRVAASRSRANQRTVLPSHAADRDERLRRDGDGR